MQINKYMLPKATLKWTTYMADTIGLNLYGKVVSKLLEWHLAH